ncbi:pyridoxal-phosphate dependent enzyme [Haloarculaceae archaeon H-GB2-1]|nr:pyridoxal-phosphate dependent enzyme [Haloarculaceae archaeon H-GB11]MEA5406819.1 pyridoxal-phosphate dependent enzyme [Haloarculaceae archaeon H-GB2-1]
MALDHVETLECTLCGATYDPEQVVYTCPEHDGVAGILEVVYDYDVVQDRFDASLDGDIRSQWKYRAFLPVDTEATPVTLDEGGTDLLDVPRLGAEFDVDLRVKNDGLNPTGCFKDRATSVAATKARFAGRNVVTCASTGNAAASLAGYAARAGLDCRIFVPESAPEGNSSSRASTEPTSSRWPGATTRPTTSVSTSRTPTGGTTGTRRSTRSR